MTTVEKPIESNHASVTIRLIMQGKEVGSIIGKKGEIVKRFRDESGAKINISDGSCPERIVTVTGHTDAIYKAFTLICKKFEEDLASLVSPNTVPRPPITFRLIVPASQCGSLIGKGGSKIKEIREVTGASIQVASEMLPNSTERAVTISGSSESVTQCVYHICCVMSESPPKGITVPYRPMKPGTVNGLGGQAVAAAQQAASMVGPTGHAAFLPQAQANQNAAAAAAAAAAAINQAAVAASLVPVSQAGKLGSIPLSSLSALNGLGGFGATGALNPAALAALAGPQSRPQPNSQQSHEMTVPNELIGCIIGKGGSKIAEIRQLSGAMIRISNCEDRENGGNTDRTITITGNTESVALAQYLINMSMELHKANLEAAQPMVSNPNLALNPFITQIHPCYYPTQMPFGALMAGQQLQQQQQQQGAVQQQLVAPVSAGGPLPPPVATLASNMFPQQAVVSQQQLVNSLVSRTNSSMINTMPGNNCYTYANGTNGAGNNAMNVNNLAAALPIAYFLSKPSAVAAAICSQAGGQTCSSSCTGTTTTVSSASPYLVSNGGIMSAQQQQQAAAAMLGLQSLAAVHQQSSAHTPSSASNSYHVTPKLKSPAGLLTVSSGRGTDKFSPY